VETAELPLRESGRLGAVSAPEPRPRVLERSDSLLPQHRGIPLAAAERILTTAAESTRKNGSANQKETRQCR
jgi:hypothetical protein